MSKKITLNLTEEQARRLSSFLELDKARRIRERDSWQKSAEEKNEDGTPKYKHAGNNVRWWDEVNAVIEDVCSQIDKEVYEKITLPLVKGENQ